MIGRTRAVLVIALGLLTSAALVVWFTNRGFVIDSTKFVLKDFEESLLQALVMESLPKALAKEESLLEALARVEITDVEVDESNPFRGTATKPIKIRFKDGSIISTIIDHATVKRSSLQSNWELEDEVIKNLKKSYKRAQE